MLYKLNQLKPLIGNTPLMKLDHPNLQLYAKLEGYNFTGSIKDRPAYGILEEAIRTQKIGPDTIVVESSSGNFAIALATICKKLGIRFIAVIDKFTNPANESLLRVLCHDVIKIMEPDETGGCLLNRIRKIRSLLEEIPDAFWPNQYENPLNPKAHFEGTAMEICRDLDQLDVIFIAVSSGGSVTGISQRVKKDFPNCRTVAVDAEGSVIFGGPPRPRPIPGMGSSMRPKVLEAAKIDEVVYVNELEIVNACNDLLGTHGLFLGGSSGGAYAAALKYDYSTIEAEKPTVAFISADMGKVYLDNIYNANWVAQLAMYEPNHNN